MNRVLDWLYIGDAQDGRDVSAIERAGITAVFNATQESDQWPAEFKARVPYLRLDQPDGAPIAEEKLDKFAAWLAIQCTRPGALLVHCGAGVSRASTFSAVAMMLVVRASWREAIEKIHSVRPIIAPHPLLVASVSAWWRARGGPQEALDGAA